MKLWLARHALPRIDPGICYGRLDVAADIAATAVAAQALAAQLPAGMRVISSPLQRCRQLAVELERLRPELAYTIDGRLQEMDFGSWEGQRWEGIGEAAISAWTDDFARRPAGGSGSSNAAGESVASFMSRVASAFDELLSHPDVLWITHAGVIRAAGLLARGIRSIERADQWPLDAPKYGQWRILDLEQRPAD